MAASAFKEAVNGILNFNPGRFPVEGQSINIGRAGDYEVFFGNYVVQDRLVRAAGQPLLFSWRTRPTIALRGINGNGDSDGVTLTYKQDIKQLDARVAWQVSKRLKEWSQSKAE